MSYCKDTREDLLELRKMPIVNSINELSNELLISEKILNKLHLHSYTYYKEFCIKKKGKKNETRIIAAPKYTLKVVQAWILRNILEKVELHPCAMAYRRGIEYGIIKNAVVHKENEYIMKIDFKNFFSSISKKKVFFMFNGFGYSRDISDLFANICTYKGSLPQGAVTSPNISNIILKDFDYKLYQHCINNTISYTRYSDDITLSCHRRRPLENIEPFIVGLVNESKFLDINSDKSFKIYGKDTAKIVTGLLTNNDDIRVTRKYKRQLRSQIYNEIKVENKEPSTEIYGKLAFVKHVDPCTYIQMIKYFKKIEIDHKFKIDFIEKSYEGIELAT